MFVKSLSIEGYKTFKSPFTINLSKGLNVIVGENGSGKTAIIDAIRLLLLEDEYGRSPISDTDFHKPFKNPHEQSKSIRIHCLFDELSQEERVAFLPWCDLNGKATLTLLVDNKQNNQGRYKRILWGGASRSSVFEWELFQSINCIYLPPLRDAESKLRDGKGSRLARLFKNLNKKQIEDTIKNNKDHPLVDKVRSFNEEIAKDETLTISQVNDLIRKRLIDAIGNVFGQDTYIQFSETSFSRIVESLRLFFFPEANTTVSKKMFRSLEENSLGYNNLLYLATVLAELIEVTGDLEYLKVLLIEEPEAHLHPQLQIRLLKYLEKVADDNNVQVVVTTHSPVLASSVSIDSLIHLSSANQKPLSISLNSCGLGDSSAFINRWLDATKSILLFAKAIILVEGIAEAMLLPELAKIVLNQYNFDLKRKLRIFLNSFLENEEVKSVRDIILSSNFEIIPKLIDKNGNDKSKEFKKEFIDNGLKLLPKTLEDTGISIINMNGIYFKHFMQLFTNLTKDEYQKISLRCSGITDNDPPKDSKPSPSNLIKGNNPALELIDLINSSENARLYSNPLKTFEYDLAFEDENIKIMSKLLSDLWPYSGRIKRKLKDISDKHWNKESDLNKAEAAFEILTRIEDDNIGKGFFAQALAEKIKSDSVTFSVPQYIHKALIWACGGNPDVI